MAGEEEQADMAFKKMRKYGAQLLALSGKLVSPVITPVKKEIGLRLTQNDIPKFQLSSWPDVPFPGNLFCCFGHSRGLAPVSPCFFGLRP
ncbi:hypothetical protein G6F57_023601 [Rhizopus arrhizus]|nr:hypothetical protein G6F30_014236 [Rhizopus arrhizus]KAG1053509.1 hypothetical protein G6F41_014235 [Rhizopus arrhizus]KAG1079551.1 hypothetical protein G6F39_014257 [Rhizopus arrhizus]KAG1317852.1 hypothetical protein G6F63_015487 [Rhizopus arrhizus]KAG1421191.1 hypothetical protein G6F57_023601 [Rhizopus arrhizus]